jgi:hypothetical protein
MLLAISSHNIKRTIETMSRLPKVVPSPNHATFPDSAWFDWQQYNPEHALGYRLWTQAAPCDQEDCARLPFQLPYPSVLHKNDESCR